MARLLGPAAGRPSLPDLLASGEMVLAPGCYDALGARLVEEAGFDAAYMTGFGTAAARLGRPDVGLLTLTEMADNARRIAQAVEIPVIADADTGYGNPINVIRTVQEYEAAGVAAVHIEDQVMPKKCGHMEGKQLIGADEMVAKVEAAVAARRSPELLDHRPHRRPRSRGPGRRDRACAAPTARPEPTSCSSRRRSRSRRSRRSLRASRTCRCCSTTPRAARHRRSATSSCAASGSAS